MSSNEIYKKLVDLYAGGELPQELNMEMEAAASKDTELAEDMTSLRQTVNLVKQAQPTPEFTEESYQRILMKMYARGIEVQTQTEDPTYMQYQLPMQG